MDSPISDFLRQAIDMLAEAPGATSQSASPVIVKDSAGQKQITEDDFANQVGDEVAAAVADLCPTAPKTKDGLPDDTLIDGCRAAAAKVFQLLAAKHGSVDAAIEGAKFISSEVRAAGLDADGLMKSTFAWMAIPRKAREFVESTESASIALSPKPQMVLGAAKSGGSVLSGPLSETYDSDYDNSPDDEARDLINFVEPSDCARQISPEGLPSDRLFGSKIHTIIQEVYIKLYGSGPHGNTVAIERAYFERGERKKLIEAPEYTSAFRLDQAVTVAWQFHHKQSGKKLSYKRPDIADLTTGDFYEIKSRNEAELGYRQLVAYYVDPYNDFIQSSQKEPQAGLGATHRIVPWAFPEMYRGSDVIVAYDSPCPGLILYTITPQTKKDPRPPIPPPWIKTKAGEGADRKTRKTVAEKVHENASASSPMNTTPDENESELAIMCDSTMRAIKSVMVTMLLCVYMAALIQHDIKFAISAAVLIAALALIGSVVLTALWVGETIAVD